MSGKHADCMMDCDSPATRDICMSSRNLIDWDVTISTRVRELSDLDPSVHGRAAQFLFERAHTSHPRSGDNKVQMGIQGAVAPLCALMLSPLEDTRYQACSALSELAFANEENCRRIIATPGCLNAINFLLQPENGNAQCDAALIVNNCAAFCTDTCLPIIESGILFSLQNLVTSMDSPAKNVSVGAINSLSRCFEARQAMLDAGVVERTLAVVLSEPGRGDQYEARIARAAMALANLTGHQCSILSADSNSRSALSSICKIMRFSLEDKCWAGIYFAPYSVCLPMYNLSLNAANRQKLVEFGMIVLMADLLNGWKQGNSADDTLMLTLQIVEQIALHPDDEVQRLEAKKAKLVEALQGVVYGSRGEPEACKGLASSILRSLKQRHVAIWMCQHHRLGAKSLLHLLDDSVTDMIVGFASI